MGFSQSATQVRCEGERERGPEQLKPCHQNVREAVGESHVEGYLGRRLRVAECLEEDLFERESE